MSTLHKRQMLIKVYTFSQLSEKAKEKAIYDEKVNNGYAHADEALESLRKLAKHFDGRLIDYSIDWFNGSYSSAKFDMPELSKAEIKEKLEELGDYNPETLMGHGECKLTGYCADEDAIDGFRKSFHAGESDIDQLMEDAFRHWLKAAHDDCEGQYEEDNFSEFADMNDIRYLKNGEVVDWPLLPDDDEVNATELETAMVTVLKQIIADLPQKRDWLDPEVEAQAKALIEKYQEQVG